LFSAITWLRAILGRKLCPSLLIVFVEPALSSLKLADAAADSFADLRQLSRSKDDERQYQDDNQFSGTDVSKHTRFSFRRAVRLRCQRASRQQWFKRPPWPSSTMSARVKRSPVNTLGTR